MATPQVQRAIVEDLRPRLRGRRGVAMRRRIQREQGSMCKGCGLLWVQRVDHVDHKVPREQGGSDDPENLQLLCAECHEEKTDAELHGRRWVSKLERSR